MFNPGNNGQFPVKCPEACGQGKGVMLYAPSSLLCRVCKCAGVSSLIALFFLNEVCVLERDPGREGEPVEF